jgi:hypothetical protein
VGGGCHIIYTFASLCLPGSLRSVGQRDGAGWAGEGWFVGSFLFLIWLEGGKREGKARGDGMEG